MFCPNSINSILLTTLRTF